MVFVAVGTLGLASQAQAAIYYWQDSAPGVAQPAPREQVRRAKSTRRGEKRSRAVVEKESKPQGPLIISISIAQQKLRIYDAHGLFAETPISTGMPGHLTPMGVFSIIQKQKFHRSNIYSGAPMPFMQRITWSGVAMHAGVLPGHPASHGCIRMPMAFAVKMYGWTRMGARVIVAPGDVTPASFAHPLLAAVKVTPQPIAVQETKADVVAVPKTQQPASAEASAPPAAAETKIELRPTVGHVEETKPAAQVQTADASGALPASLSKSATPDSATAGERASQPLEVTASDHRDASKTTTDADAPKPEIDPIAAKRDEAAALNEKPARATPVETASDQPAKPEAATVANETTKPSDKAASATPTELKAKTNTESQGEKPASATATAPAALPAATSETPLKGDIKSDFAKTAASKTDPGFSFKNTGQIAVFVSRKDSKLYVRQNFSPLFDVPVTIAPDARPLGTHIFTAQVDGTDANVLHWSVVSLPVPSRPAGRHAEDERNLRGRRFASAGPIQAKPVPMPDDPAEALDRLNLPAEVMAKIYEAVSTGGSIIVSDQGIAAGETGEGTDFIVSLR
ncbi:L,D-transpeptidase family protein [Bradyrhizobium sp.]|uniref:L,D-transpeptidase n=1 Tax=Bradyrhizobium sp. TaxID=376 RepID=UPI003C63B5EE